jgi:hypothetical protein
MFLGEKMVYCMVAGSFGHTLSGIKYNWTSASPLATENLELAQVTYLSNLLRAKSFISSRLEKIWRKINLFKKSV